jgi:4-hydroxybenzoyl-CoA reductase subunit beta
MKPRSVQEAVAARIEHPHSRFIAGGTDLVVNMRHGIVRPELLIDLGAIEGFDDIDLAGDGAVIGAGVTIAALARENAIRSRYRAVAQAAEAIAGPGHRVMGTVGGNLCLDTRCIYYNQSEWWRHANGYCLKHAGDICHVAPQGQRCHAAYTGDLAPALLAFGAEIDVAGATATRRVPLADLYAEDGKAHLTLDKGELVVSVRLPPSAAVSGYAKVRVRGAMDYPLAGVAVALSVRDRKIDHLRLALTGTNSRPILLQGTDKLSGAPVDDKMLTDINRLVQKQVQPMRTTLASANYRRLAAAAIASRLVRTLYDEAVS